MPAPKEMKSALMSLQGIAAADFLAKHQLKGASGNKLAKIKRAQFEAVRRPLPTTDTQTEKPASELTDVARRRY